MEQHPIEGLMKTAMENLKQMIDVNTIIGDPVETPDGSVILTISKVGFGFVAGGSEFSAQSQGKQNSQGSGTEQKNSSDHPFGGGSGGGVSITPIAFLIVNSSGVKMVHVDEQTHLVEKLIDFAPQVVEKIQGMMSGKKSSDKSNNRESNNVTSNTQKKQDLDF
ncbi:sporulation protein YtfJ [Lottiidibacillus patelloidae]|uniref:Sporulation protein YtfJ n=1 Tax=Lottiidibacillus patelloidae TaxID=2670334 RepID=A0A263BWN3_9BACI|nr:GerW family sporulation protein [Lottiidibacillus patelloidae]OZM57988.1 sporulation protein YtfJ [Lottiidibacillus patelloidae]